MCPAWYTVRPGQAPKVTRVGGLGWVRAERQSEPTAPADVDICPVDREPCPSETVIEVPFVSVRAWSTLSGELIRCAPEANPHNLPRICEAALLKGKAVSFKRFGFVGRCDFEIECS